MEIIFNDYPVTRDYFHRACRRVNYFSRRVFPRECGFNLLQIRNELIRASLLEEQWLDRNAKNSDADFRNSTRRGFLARVVSLSSIECFSGYNLERERILAVSRDDYFHSKRASDETVKGS